MKLLTHILLFTLAIGFISNPISAQKCSAGTLTTTGEISLCGDEENFEFNISDPTIPPGGGMGLFLDNILGGTGGPDNSLIAFRVDSTNLTLDAGLNGIIDLFNFEPLSGLWVIKGTTAGADNIICSITQDSLIVNFIRDNPIIEGIVSNAVDELTVNISGGLPPFEFLWSDGQITQTATGLGSGEFGVTITDANGCSVEGESTISVSTNIIKSLNALSILPNPNKGFFSVQLSFDKSERIEVEVLDITGKLIQKENKEFTSGQFDFNLRGSEPGVYFVRLTAGFESMTQRIVISK